MEICGFQRISLIDYPGKLTSIVFVPGCNMRCPFCQNKDLVLRNYDRLVPYTEEQVLDQLNRSKKFIDAVEITGGEPTLQVGLKEFIRKCRGTGLSVKLDTNGLNPNILREILSEGLADYVAMDIKSMLEPNRYNPATGINNYFMVSKILESIKAIMDLAPDYEFRTTVVPTLIELEDLPKIAKKIEGAKAYYLQQFVPRNTLNPDFSKIAPYPLEALVKARDTISNEAIVKKCEVRF